MSNSLLSIKKLTSCVERWLKRIINYLISWCETSLKSNLKIELREQFNYLRELFIRTIDLIQNEDNIHAIENAFQTIYSAGNFTNYIKQEESILCIDDFSKIIDECSKSIIVSDFYGSFFSFSFHIKENKLD